MCSGVRALPAETLFPLHTELPQVPARPAPAAHMDATPRTRSEPFVCSSACNSPAATVSATTNTQTSIHSKAKYARKDIRETTQPLRHDRATTVAA
eukprot:5950244-Amphidinium_carterae.1